MIISYKCPNCGSDMAFDSETGSLSCSSCGRQDNIESLPKENIAARFSDDEAKEYQCENCGAILITEAETTATTCSFCGVLQYLQIVYRDIWHRRKSSHLQSASKKPSRHFESGAKRPSDTKRFHVCRSH